MKWVQWALPATLCITLAGCGSHTVPPVTPATPASLRDISDAQWDNLARQRIYFGHQSVGQNVLEGIRNLMKENPKIRLRIVRSSYPATVDGPALVESPIGENGDPQSKADAFDAALDGGMGRLGGIAMYKYCYVDIRPSTDVEQMFEQYRQRIRALRKKYPALTFVHITLPLTTVESSWKYYVKKMLGRPTLTDLDAKRTRYNQLLRQEYDATDPIFDLARVESTHADGSRSFVTQGGQTVYTLAPELTIDGGHLNEAGRRAAAQEFLRVLSTLPSKDQAISPTSSTKSGGK